MTKGEFRRRFLEKKYGHLYKRVGNFQYKCYYCGSEEKVGLDHVPNLRFLEGLNTIKFVKSGGSFVLYPSCAACNIGLSNCIYTNPLDRIEYLSSRILKKMDKIEVWGEDELREMGHSLRSLIANQQSKLSIMQERLKMLLNRSDELEGRPENE